MTDIDMILENYHNNASMLVKSLIEHSREYNECVSVDYTDELKYELILVCDDSIENGNVFEFWGEDWTVHLHRA